MDNPKVARDLVDIVENAILERAENPTAYEPVAMKYKHQHDYYSIHVKNYIVYYIVYDTVMEIRRFLHASRNRVMLL